MKRVIAMLGLSWMMACGSAGSGTLTPDDACTFVRHRGLCEAQVTLEPREAESPDEATTLEVRWTWLGDTPAEVPPRLSRWFLTAREAMSLGSAIDELGKSPCVVEEAVSPAECNGRVRIMSIEAEP